MRLPAMILLYLSLAPSARAEEAVAVVHEDWLDRAALFMADNDAGTLTAPMDLCEDAGCLTASVQELAPDEAARIGGLFDGAGDAAAERAAIGRAVALFETFAGARNGTWRDHARNERLDGDEAGQLDCVAEAINTRTYLGRLERSGLLHFHRVEGFVHRYAVLLQHVAVGIVEDESGESFVVDSWVGANGEEPSIEPYGTWRMEWQV